MKYSFSVKGGVLKLTYKVALMISTLLFVLLISKCTSAPKPPLKIGGTFLIGYEPLFLASRVDILPNNKYKFIEYSSSTETIRAFRNKSIDLATLTMDEAVQLMRDGLDIKLVLILDESFGADALIAQSDIKNISQLKRKKIGIEQTAMAKYFFSLFLGNLKLKQSEFEMVYLEPNDHINAFKNKKIDAVITHEPISSDLKKFGGHALFDSKSTPGQIVDVLVINSDFFENNKNETKEIIQAWGTALAYISLNPVQSYQYIAERQKITPEEVKKTISNIKFVDLQTNHELLNDSNTIKDMVQRLTLHFDQQSNIIAHQINLKKFISLPVDWYISIAEKK